VSADAALGEGDARTRRLDAALKEAAHFPVLAACTPSNAAREHARLCNAWLAGIEASPRWEPSVVDRLELARAQRTIEDARALAGKAVALDRWSLLYAERLEETARDLEVVAAAFTEGIGKAAQRRFGELDDDANRLALAWAAAEREPPSVHDDRLVESGDEHDPASLVSRMRRAIHAHKLGVRVVLRDRIGALAAAGDGVVIVARGRRIPDREVARVVLHEIEGHVLPRERGRARSPSLCTLGSAGASEDEEGRALVLEERAGALHADRRRTLAARHYAAKEVISGASFVEVVRALRRDIGLGCEDAVAIASRVMRGAHGVGRQTHSGIARERVYLPAYLRVGKALVDEQTTLDELGSARLSIAARRSLAGD
jgi:hypothetical protein